MNPTASFQGHGLPFSATIPVGSRERVSALVPKLLACLGHLVPMSQQQQQQQQQQDLALEAGSAQRHQMQQDNTVCPGSSTAEPAFRERHRRTQGSPDLILMNSVTTASL